MPQFCACNGRRGKAVKRRRRDETDTVIGFSRNEKHGVLYFCTVSPNAALFTAVGKYYAHGGTRNSFPPSHLFPRHHPLIYIILLLLILSSGNLLHIYYYYYFHLYWKVSRNLPTSSPLAIRVQVLRVLRDTLAVNRTLSHYFRRIPGRVARLRPPLATLSPMINWRYNALKCNTTSGRIIRFFHDYCNFFFLISDSQPCNNNIHDYDNINGTILSSPLAISIYIYTYITYTNEI